MRGNAHITHTGQVQTSADRRTIDGCDDRDFKVVQRAGYAVDAFLIVVAVIDWLAVLVVKSCRHVLDVAPCAESLARTGEHHGAYVSVGGDLGACSLDLG